MRLLLTATSMLAAMFAMAQTETVLFEGEKVIGNWDGYEEFKAVEFQNAQAGDKIVVDLKDVLTGDDMWASCQLAKSDWSELVAYPLYDHPDQTQVTFTLTEEEASEVKANGVLVRGCFYTLLKVTYICEEGSTPVEPGDAKTIWSGDWETTSWGGMQELAWGGYDWSSFAEGDHILFTVEGIGTDPTLKPCDSSWTELSCGFIALKQGEQTVSIIPNAADIAKLKENGLVISGNNIKLTKVAIAKTSGVNMNMADVENPQETVIYDLQGRRLSQAKGLVIVNGKKMIIK